MQDGSQAFRRTFEKNSASVELALPPQIEIEGLATTRCTITLGPETHYWPVSVAEK